MASALVNKKTFYQNPEQFFAGIKAMRAEHRPRAQLRQRAQLVEHKFFERVVRHDERLSTEDRIIYFVVTNIHMSDPLIASS